MIAYGEIAANAFEAVPEKFEDRMRRIRRQYRFRLKQPVGDDAPWFVLCVRTGCEKRVEEALGEAGVEVFVPMRKGKARKRRGRWLPPKDEVLMIGYVLIRCVCSNETMNALMSFEHVAGILGGWEKPFAVGPEKVMNINCLARSGEFNYERAVAISLKAGEVIRIAGGIFSGLCGEVVTPNGTGKGDVVVEVEMFGQKTPAILPLAMIEKM
ncbi:transcription termination/antitermination protein NusG [Martelella mediterranea]|uniref:Transcriptional antiterminator NusG n=1 Tax=Martelella mediterranea TaxID=293089 RepID=A0A4R3NIY3_9HYPH|nr:transcription termination/antitermination NusG family protein [Martelella mediterranea]TCT34691.1 transcriptional antiterminator NusG [Martelella mediterranea]